MKRITVQTTIHSDIEKVWEYWTNPRHIVNWNFATDTWCCPSAENDLRPNGKFSYRMASRDGKMAFDFEGKYIEVIDKKRIVYIMSDGRNVDVEFLKNSDEVTVWESFEAEGTQADEQQRAGWQAILESFKTYVETK